MYNASGMEVLNAADDVDVPIADEIMANSVVSSLTCDLSRVTTMVLAPSRSDHLLQLHQRQPVRTTSSRTIRHQHGVAQKLVAINQWYAGQVFELRHGAQSVKEGAGTLFDNTVVFWCNELGTAIRTRTPSCPSCWPVARVATSRPRQAVTMPRVRPHNAAAEPVPRMG